MGGRDNSIKHIHFCLDAHTHRKKQLSLVIDFVQKKSAKSWTKENYIFGKNLRWHTGNGDLMAFGCEIPP